jgi:DNA-binding NarL/FixJ family response regulator
MVMDRLSIRILLVDDHEIFRAGLRLLLEGESGLNVIGEARNKAEAFQAVRNLPDVILLDLDLGDETATDFLPDLVKAGEPARVVVLTGVPDPELHLRAICLGAVGLVHKLEAPWVLLKAIRKVHEGEAWLNRDMVASAMKRLQQRTKIDPEAGKISSLTARELEIVALIGEGRRNRAIGEQLYISEKTVRHYLTSIFTKLDVGDRLELMIYAYQHGLAKLPSREPTSKLA